MNEFQKVNPNEPAELKSAERLPSSLVRPVPLEPIWLVEQNADAVASGDPMNMEDLPQNTKLPERLWTSWTEMTADLGPR